MATDISELKCRDCVHYVLSGWWDPQKVCELSGFPVGNDESACISVSPKQKCQSVKNDIFDP